MPSVAQQIRDALIVEVNKVSALLTVSSKWTHWQQEKNLPAAYVLRDTDDAERGPTQSKEVIAHFRIVLVIRSDNPEDIFDTLDAAIENQIEDDPTLGGLALDAVRTGVDRFATAEGISGQVYPREIFYDVLYRHARAAA
jgi:hypothetical protein